MSFLATLLLLYQPIKGLSRVQGVLEAGRAALSRIEAILWDARLLPSSGDVPPPEAITRLALDGVSFSRGGQPIFKKVNFTFKRGEVHGVIGPNGSGKTTLAWLLARMMEPDEGTIFVNDVPLPAILPASWRSRIGWVTQDPLLGPGTIRENVLFGTDAVDDVVLAQAAKESGLSQVLAQKPEGWAYRLGDHGLGLSGGEKQRVAICRALVRDPQVLIFDEPTAHLDKGAASDLGAVIDGLRSNRIIIVITHQPAIFGVGARHLDLSAGNQAASGSPGDVMVNG